MTAKQAANRPITDAHTIWELVLHAATWIRVVEKGISDGAYPTVPDEVNWPEVKDTSESAWEAAIEALKKTHKKLEKHVQALTDVSLNKKAANSVNTYYFVLQGIINHNSYHAGQIALLKKQK